ncbi:MAG: IS200/IS605 family transposase [Anaerolineales bacterium]|nr:IS200/IS605 family transposase [Anaerolineales bacterium]
MSVSILISTSNAGFGELVSQILLETGEYDLTVARNKTATLTALEDIDSGLLILETDLEGDSIESLVAEARKLVPELLLIVIVAEGKSEKELEEGLCPDAILLKPVYLPDLVNSVEQVLAKGELKTPGATGPLVKVEAPAGEKSPAPQWLSDVNLAAQYLTSLTLESAAQASLITNLDQIWAYAGELPQPAAEELARTVSQHFQNGGGSDLARFIRLEQTGSEYMLYATGLGGPFVLSTVFDTEMPFSKIRAQASNLAMALASPPPPEEVEDLLEYDDEEEFFKEGEALELWPLLDDVPPPIPDLVSEDFVEQKEISLLEELMEGSVPDEFSSDTMVISGLYHSARPDASEQQDLGETAVSASKQRAEETVRELDVQRDAEDMEESSPQHEANLEDLPTAEEEIVVEPVSPSMYNLTYACVLIPRFLDHHLIGDVAQRLSDWITHLCVAFGWRLEQLTISPKYVQWMVNVPPNTSPGYLMRTIREHTSRRMFVEFPALDQENLVGDFWAPGYLVLGTPQPPPITLIEEFIENTRSRQGLQE